MRPADDLCAKCKRVLPPESERPELTKGTDVCGWCGSATIHYLEGRSEYRKWVAGWEGKLASMNRVAASYGVRQRVRLHATKS